MAETTLFAEINRIVRVKEEIRQAIGSKNVTVNTGCLVDEYAYHIGLINTGAMGGGEPERTVATGDLLPQIDRIEDAKEAMRLAIIAHNVPVGENELIDVYPERIRAIQLEEGGGGGDDDAPNFNEEIEENSVTWKPGNSKWNDLNKKFDQLNAPEKVTVTVAYWEKFDEEDGAYTDRVNASWELESHGVAGMAINGYNGNNPKGIPGSADLDKGTNKWDITLVYASYEWMGIRDFPNMSSDSGPYGVYCNVDEKNRKLKVTVTPASNTNK